MICLKNRTFAVSQTTLNDNLRPSLTLWFAWKIVLLLEKSYFCSIANNDGQILIPFKEVVICLKNRTFAVSQTTVHCRATQYFWLWFAWKIVLLQYRKQQTKQKSKAQGGCDLLEKSYFCSIANNIVYSHKMEFLVVICLKNRTFAVSQTTKMITPIWYVELWFAWKIVLLQYRKQLLTKARRLQLRCDLLEKSYFCSIANNSHFG